MLFTIITTLTGAVAGYVGGSGFVTGNKSLVVNNFTLDMSGHDHSILGAILGALFGFCAGGYYEYDFGFKPYPIIDILHLYYEPLA